MLRRIAGAVAVTLVIGLVANGAGPSGAAFSGANGKIAFVSHRDGNDEIYVMNADGANQTDLSNNPANDTEIAWSPNGAKIAFTSYREAGKAQVFVMDANGANPTKLTDDPVGAGWPAWSPDGTKIAFHGLGEGNFNIYVMNADGTNQTRLTDNPAGDKRPRWSPDGTKIAFVSDRDGNNEIYVMNAGGANQTNLTNNPAGDTEIAWSPNGAKIAFMSYREGGKAQVFVMDADGANPTKLTDDPVGAGWPAWSPDGTKIAFHGLGEGNFEIYVMNADGTNQTRLTDNPAADAGPEWQPLGGLGGDTDCDGQVSSVDGLFTLRHVASLPVNLPPGCPGIVWPASHGPNPIISSGTGGLNGTWQFDFDTGTQGSQGDVYWDIVEYVGHTVGNIVPGGSARAVSLGMVDFDSLSYADLWYLPFSMTPIHGSDDAGSQLAPGDVFAVLTRDGNVAKVRVETYGYTLQLRWVTYQGAPRGDVGCDGQVSSIDALFILRHVAHLPVTLPPGCPEIGT